MIIAPIYIGKCNLPQRINEKAHIAVSFLNAGGSWEITQLKFCKYTIASSQNLLAGAESIYRQADNV